jgi:hypothetical protein
MSVWLLVLMAVLGIVCNGTRRSCMYVPVLGLKCTYTWTRMYLYLGLYVPVPGLVCTYT